jgi:cytoskeletal protein CcmA (bactofilin family)
MWKRDESVKPSSTSQGQSVYPASVEPHSADKAHLGKSVRITGDVRGSEDLIVNGQIEGSVDLSGHTLTIGADALVKGDVAATTVFILGAVAGNVIAEDKIEIGATGSLNGDMNAQRLIVADGAFLSGKADISKNSRDTLALKRKRA